MSDLADEYSATVAVGYKELQSKWRHLTANTRALFVSRGLASESGAIPEEKPNDDQVFYELGILKAAASAKLPVLKTGEPIPFEAARDEVLQACDAVLYKDLLHDPAFARLALIALAHHCIADGAERAKPTSRAGPAALIVEAFFKLVFLLVGPGATAVALWAAATNQLWLAVGAAYFGAFGIATAIRYANDDGTPSSPVENKDYQRWWSFSFAQMNVFAPEGTLEHLRKMLNDGVRVPSAAFDLCRVIADSASPKA